MRSGPDATDTGRTPLDLPLGRSGATFIEASAGTGKTHSLTTLVARLVAEEGLGLDQILVVTFTRAATAELRDRIRRTLGAALAAVKTGDAGANSQAQDLLARWERAPEAARAQAARRLEAAMHDIDRAGVYTIHGFCQRVLADLAFESGFPFGFEVSGDNGEMVAGAVRDFWRRRLYPAPMMLVRYAEQSGFMPHELAQWALSRRAKAGIEIKGVEPLPESIETREAAWRRVFEAARAEWEQGRDSFRTELLGGDWLKRNIYRLSTVERELSQIEAMFTAPEPRLAKEGLVGRYGAQCLTEACKKDCALPENPLFEALDRLEEASRTLRSDFDRWLRWARREVMTEVRESVRRRVREDRRLGYDDLLIELDDALGGEGGKRLAARIRRAYPCALIDEYQDTDPLQARIFTQVYGELRDDSHGDEQAPIRPGPDGEGPGGEGAGARLADAGDAGPGALFAVGDPKQSIYRFRGADVFAYLAARRAARERLHLEFNWRSVPGLVEAVNEVFAGSIPFVAPEIEYRPVTAARGGGNPLRIAGGEGGGPLRFWLVSRQQDDRLQTKGSMNLVVAGATADEIARLLELAARGEATIEGKPLVGADIAVLVRTRAQGRLMTDALRERGVRSIEIDDGSVFDTREAEQIERLLWALVQPGREAQVRGALAGDLFGLDASALQALGNDEAQWSGWAQRLAHWRSDWDARGIGSVLLGLLEREGGAQRLIGHRDGARRLTNIRHLAELLQEAQARQRFAPVELAAWLSHCRAGAERPQDSARLRLESDEQLVRVLTMHGAKGLEFPVVFCPFAWDVRRPARTAAVDAVYHLGAGEGYREILHLDPDEQAVSIEWVEEFSEAVRLLYVALTRAKYRCVVAWGQVSGAEYAPLAWLLHRAGHDAGAQGAGDAAALEAVAARFCALSAKQWLGEIEGYAKRFPDAISMTVLNPFPRPARAAALSEGQMPALAAREPGRALRRIRQLTSFSALCAESGGAGPRPDDAEADRPDHDQSELPGDDAAQERGQSAFTFPRGPIAGSCLHRIFEKLDEASGALVGRPGSSANTARPDLDAICRDALAHFGIDGDWGPVARAMIERTRAVRLQEPGREGPNGDRGFCLSDPVRRLVELEFHFPVQGLDLARLAAVLVEHGYPDPFARPARSGASEPASAPIHGFLRGYIDLVAEHDGRWYILDYKSNWLGPEPGGYAPQALAGAMRASGYTLQSLIYLVALHRYLAVRLPGYDCERHIGGAFYLFVRGIDPAAGMSRGVYFDRPDAACLRALDGCFGGGGA